jgi:2-polyprenyl-3-methyl-5-hydroxy-6-metoxy-1,4-benzoquinol methylase
MNETPNQAACTMKANKGLASLGLTTSYLWNTDPQQLVILLARYKFVASLLHGKKYVMEFGCGDAFCSRVVKQEVQRLIISDIDELLLEDAAARSDKDWPMELIPFDATARESRRVEAVCDAIYALDVLEHIPKKREHYFLRNCKEMLRPDGVLILGTPSLPSDDLRKLLTDYFLNVFLFAMSDETIHTGFLPTGTYLMAVCTVPRKMRNYHPSELA